MRRSGWMYFSLVVVTLFFTVFGFNGEIFANSKIVISHRAASGYLPEHTLPAVAMAYAHGADFIEQDLAMTKDGVLIVIHDIYLDANTNVKEVFPERNREDGRYYACDFTLEEIKQLQVNERINVKTGEPAYPTRFPVGASKFEIPTFVEEIEMIQGLNKSTGLDVGIYPELKGPAFHHENGLDIEKAFLEVVNAYGYTTRDANIFVQSFEFESLVRLRELGSDLPLVYLIYSANEASAEALDRTAVYADGIGPYINMIETPDGEAVDNYSLIHLAHERGLVIHPWTFRSDDMPSVYGSFEEMVRHFFYDIGVDGLFTDFTDLAVQVVRENEK